MPNYSMHEIQERLESLVFMVMTTRRTLKPVAEALTGFGTDRVDLVIEQVRQITATSIELAYHYSCAAPQSLAALSDADLAGWTMSLLETYDRQGIQGCIKALAGVEAYAAHAREARRATRFGEIAVVLERFVAGLSGRPLGLAEDAVAWTDTETIYLPSQLAVRSDSSGNFLLYKTLTAFCWAQTRYGTWRDSTLSTLDQYPERQRALALFAALETVRLGAQLSRELPGLWRQVQALRLPTEAAWDAFVDPLLGATADVAASLALLGRAYESGMAATPQPFQVALRPERVAEIRRARTLREQAALQQALAVLADELSGRLHSGFSELPAFEVRHIPDASQAGYAYQLVLGDQEFMPSADVQQLLNSIVQDFGHIPPECLVAAGQGRYDRKAGGDRPAADLDPEGAGGTLYDEWDHRRQAYRRDWCRVRERLVRDGSADFVVDTLRKHRGLLKHLLRTFEALRGEDRLLKRQAEGEAPDIDALTEAHADRLSGLEPDHRLFLRKRRIERNIAVLFMVDMSGSTKGWINDVEREALVLLCEALERLGDRYAIYGFSGYTHLGCEVFAIKTFTEEYSRAVKSRIAGVSPRDYTRMGAAIRHLSAKLLAVEARTRLLLTLSDGRPDDEDGYRGDYGIEDTRQAVLEARSRGVQSFCITIDDQAQDYLPHMFGRAHFTVVEDVAKLPYKVSDIYRRITS